MPNFLTSLKKQLQQGLIVDRFKLRRELDRLLQQYPQIKDLGAESDIPADAEYAKTLEKWQQRAARSQQRVASRQQQQPHIAYPEQLPVAEKAAEIKEAIENHQVVIVAGETGSGKTTQIPKICLELGRGRFGFIGHTQPRRLAARSVASRLAEELQSSVGDLVGYKVRFTDQVDLDKTLIKMMTDGMLLAEIQQDRFLEAYDTIIIDEAHERSLNIDFLFGLLKRLIQKRKDLKVVITSATIDHLRFSKFFNDAPVIEVSGRTFPVELAYRPPLAAGEEEETELADGDVSAQVVSAIEEIVHFDREEQRTGARDVLVFLSGEREIRETANLLRKVGPRGLDVLPLYARLSAAEQNRIFQDHGGQRVVLATNVAETSLTVPNIRYVVDTGLARISRYSYRSKVQRLPVEKISQASANQRMGRCGRIAEGYCIRLYDEQDFEARPEFTDAEILRTNLASVILQMAMLRLGEVKNFPFIDPPDRRLVNDGYQLLEELQAIDDQRRLTPLGRQLAKLPVDPRIGRMIVAANQNGSLREVLIIAAALSVQDPRERPHDKQQQADEQHRQWQNPDSDFLAFVALWDGLEEQRQNLSNNQFNKYLKKAFISPVRYREWRDIHRQLRLSIKDLGFTENSSEADYPAMHRALLTGLLTNVAFHHEGREFLGTRNRKLFVFPGSALFKKPGKWIMAAEIVETTKVYARTVAKIQPEWLEELAAHLLKKSYFEPHWEKRPADVMAFERSSLFGLIVNPKKKVRFAPVDPVLAREIFIRSALVEQQFNSNAKFFQHNCQLVSEVEGFEHKTRRKDLLVDDEVLFDFYDERIPKDIVNGRTFDHWRKKAEKKQPERLFLSQQDLLQQADFMLGEELYPDVIEMNGVEFHLQYRFDPTHKLDGVSVLVPIGLLNQVDEIQLSWVVPGFLRDTCEALIRSLPKQKRRHFVPVPDYVNAFLQSEIDQSQSLTQQLAKQLHRMTGTHIQPGEFDWDALEPCYRMGIVVLNDQGKPIGQGYDLALVRASLSQEAQSVVEQLGSDQVEKSGITQWDFGPLPDMLDVRKQGQHIRGYPALVDQTDSVSIRLFQEQQLAMAAMPMGLTRLWLLALGQTAKYARKEFKKQKNFAFLFRGMGEVDQLCDEFLLAATRNCFLGEKDLEQQAWQIRDDEAFQQRFNSLKGQFANEARQLQTLLANITEQYQAIQKRIHSETKRLWMPIIEDIAQQVSYLFEPHFLLNTPNVWLQRYPAYLEAIQVRMERLPSNEFKTLEQIESLQELDELYETLWKAYQQQGKSLSSVEDWRWWIQEYRISLFAQRIKTAMTVSEKRLMKRYQELKSAC